VLFSHGFDDGGWAGMGRWGSPRIVTDATANGGRCVQFDWTRGGDRDQAISHTVTGTRLKLHARFRYKQSANADNSGIKKTVRIRADINGQSGRAVGTFNIQWNGFLFYGDDFAIAPWNIWQTGFETSQAIYTQNHPNTFRDRWRYIEVMLDYSEPGKQKAGMWIDGVQIINYSGNLATPMPSNFSLRDVWFASWFNDPADTRSEWFDDIVISDSYIGVPTTTQ
jgi:hypothetical protein